MCHAFLPTAAMTYAMQAAQRAGEFMASRAQHASRWARTCARAHARAALAATTPVHEHAPAFIFDADESQPGLGSFRSNSLASAW